MLAAVAAGQSFVITRRGRPIAELRPIVEGRRALVPACELTAPFREGQAIDAAAFRADVDRLLDSGLHVPSEGADPT